MRKFMAVLVGFITAIFAAFALTACGGGAHADSKAPASLIGTWHQINSKSTGVNMIATVTPGAIQINMVSRDTSSIYWLGTFDTSRSGSHSFTTVSRGDQDAMEMSITASLDSTKKFSYSHGILSYKFSILGSTSTIKLAKNWTAPVKVTRTPTYRPSFVTTPKTNAPRTTQKAASPKAKSAAKPSTTKKSYTKS